MSVYLDISFAGPKVKRRTTKIYVDPKTVEVLFLVDVVDNAMHTTRQCMTRLILITQIS